MARPREFEETDAVRRATDVFWEHGYLNASLPDLLDGMGLTRGSLYKAFKDKKSLFLRALDYYEAVAVDPGVARLTDTTAEGVPANSDGATHIMGLFEGVAAAVAGGDTRGCLLCMAAAGPEMADPEIAVAVHRGLAKLRDGIAAALDLSTAHKGLDQEDKRLIAHTLLTQYVGLKVLARGGGSVGALRKAHHQARLILSSQAG